MAQPERKVRVSTPEEYVKLFQQRQQTILKGFDDLTKQLTTSQRQYYEFGTQPARHMGWQAYQSLLEEIKKDREKAEQLTMADVTSTEQMKSVMSSLMSLNNEGADIAKRGTFLNKLYQPPTKSGYFYY